MRRGGVESAETERKTSAPSPVVFPAQGPLFHRQKEVERQTERSVRQHARSAPLDRNGW